MSKLIADAKLFFKEYGPVMLVGAGCVGAVGSTVYACKQTLKMGDLLEDAREKEETLKKLLSGELRLPDGAPYLEEDFKHDKKILDGQVIKGGVKIYAGPALALIASIAAIGVGAGAMHKQTVALSGTVATLSGIISKYRAQVDPEKDREIFLGKEETKVVQNPETGEIEEVMKHFNMNGGVGNYYGKVVFDASNPNFTKSHYHNLMFVRTLEHDLTRISDADGHIFMNDMLKHGGFKTCTEGQYLGHTSDMGPVDFGIQPYIDELKANLDEGANRVARPIVLDFARTTTNIMYVYTKAFGEDAAKKLLREE